MVQFAPAAKVAGLVGQALAPVLVAAKSPEAANESIVKAAVPVFVSVTVIGALMVASNWLPKSRRSEERRVGKEVRFRWRATDYELQTALTSSRSVHVRVFYDAGEGIRFLTVTGVQTCALPILGQALAPVLVAAKSPEAANELIVKAAVPVFVSVTVIGALMVASNWLPKSRLVGANPTTGAVPFPLSKIGRASCREKSRTGSGPDRASKEAG